MHDQKYIFIFMGKPCKFVRPSLRIEIQQEGRPQTRTSLFCWGCGAKVRGNQGRTNGKAGSQWCREMVILKGWPQQLNHSFMATLKKTHKIKKLYNHHESAAQQQPDNETNVEALSDSEHSLNKPYKDEAPIKRSIKIDPRQISNLTEEERLKIKTEHPEMNEYFCMSARDKSKFFHLLNQKYRQDIKLPEPPGSAPMKKTIRFKKRFQIKPFGYLQKCEAIKMRKSFMELYRAKDDSKSKPISKFPKNS